MTIEEQIRESLKGVLVPGAKRNLEGLKLVREVNMSDHKAEIILASTALNNGAQEWIRNKVKETLDKLSQVNEVEVKFIEAKPTELNEIHHVIAVMSGKGGVGKSLVASLIGLSLARHGYEVGILDADITGPSIPRILGINPDPWEVTLESCRYCPEPALKLCPSTSSCLMRTTLLFGVGHLLAKQLPNSGKRCFGASLIT